MFEQKNDFEHNDRMDYTGFYEEPNGADGGSNYVNVYSEPGNAPKKSGGGKTFLRIVAALAAVAIVSVSSVELYKLFGRDNMPSDWSSSAESEQDSQPESNNLETPSDNSIETTAAVSGSSASWINMAAPEGALTIPQIVEKALPSVVGISAIFEYEQDNSSYYWGFNFGGGSTTQQFGATGTGVIMSEDGYIITNAHCIYDSEYDAGKAVSVSVVMGDDDETEYDAQIVGYDVQTDLAVLKIEASGLTAAEFGDSDALSVGELVVAIGNPLGFELFGTTTCGIVSALNREVTINEKNMTLIQTDAAINSGNSGGPLLNGYGQVIGINSAKMGSTYGSASVEGLGFAIPISDAKDIINNLIDYGYVTGRPQLGITGVDITESDSQRFNLPQGIYVYAVGEGSAAAEAGIRQGDIITAIDGQSVRTTDELNELKNEHNAGEVITITIWRGGESIDLPLTLHEVQQTD